MLTVRCWPMTSGALNFSATVDARMDVSAYLDPWSSLQLSSTTDGSESLS
jgi:hypothetical protein